MRYNQAPGYPALQQELRAFPYQIRRLSALRKQVAQY